MDIVEIQRTKTQLMQWRDTLQGWIGWLENAELSVTNDKAQIRIYAQMSQHVSMTRPWFNGLIELFPAKQESVTVTRIPEQKPHAGLSWLQVVSKTPSASIVTMNVCVSESASIKTEKAAETLVEK
jgi:hypothetical protein